MNVNNEISGASSDIVVEAHKEDVKKISFPDGRIIYLVGTAHVSAQSVSLVEEIIEEVDPDAVAVELDEERYKVLKNKNAFENLDIVKIIRKGQVFFFVGHMLLSSFQKKLADRTGSKPGYEFQRATELADQKGKKIYLVDRLISTTLKRAWRLVGFWGQLKIMASSWGGSDEKIDEESIEQLKKETELTALIEDLSKELPVVKKVLIDERDTYLAKKILDIKEKTCVAVVGAGHVPGMIREIKAEKLSHSMEDLEKIPRSILFWKLLPWIIPMLVIASFIYGFVRGDGEATFEAIVGWVLINGGLSALGCLIALAHPLTILTGFIAAPITSLNPTIGAGIVTGLVQAGLRSPRVIDFINIQENASHPKKWWKNRLIKIIMVVILSSIGSFIGTFAAAPLLLRIFN